MLDSTQVTPAGILQLVELARQGRLPQLQRLRVSPEQLTAELRAALKEVPGFELDVVDE
jgi:hypothetical protein